MYPCSLCWKDTVTLIIGWGTSIKVVYLVFILNPNHYSFVESCLKRFVFTDMFLGDLIFDLNAVVIEQFIHKYRC